MMFRALSFLFFVTVCFLHPQLTRGQSKRSLLFGFYIHSHHPLLFQQKEQKSSKEAYYLSQPPQVQLVWESDEHVELGDESEKNHPFYLWLDSHHLDLPEHEKPVQQWPLFWQDLYQKGTNDQKRMLTQGLTYGEVAALMGDFYETVEQFNQAPLQEIYDLIPLIRSDKTTTSQLQKATGGRYLALAQKNKQHFSNVADKFRNIDIWKNLHKQAIQSARNQNINWAWVLSAASTHYLTDAFSGGHLRVPRDTLMKSKLGHVHSKILHDLDNDFGVLVNNQQGDGPWLAFGDGQLNQEKNKRNKELTQKALLLAKQDILTALTQGKVYPLPTEETIFPVEKIVPFPLEQKDHSRWQESSVFMGAVDLGFRTTKSMVTQNPMDLVTPTLPQEISAYRDQAFSVATKEVPGITREWVKEDNDIRAWVNRFSLAILGRQSPDEKVRLIQTLLSGWVSKEDEKSIQKIVESIPTEKEWNDIKQKIVPSMGFFLRNQQKERIKNLFYTYPGRKQ